MNILVTNLMRRCRISLLFVSIVFFTTNLFAAQPDFMVIGTASPTGVYHPAGNAICRIVNHQRKEEKMHAIHCSTLSSNGSVDNIMNLIAGEVDLAIVQSDVLKDSFAGLHGLPQAQNLRAVMALHEEQFTVVVRSKSKIRNLNDILGKRVNIGPGDSGHFYTMQAIMRMKGWTDSDFKSLSNLSVAEQASAICSGDVDVLVFNTGHPSGALRQITSNCNVRLLEVEDQDIDQLISSNVAYEKSTITAGTYQSNDSGINTISVQAILVTTDLVDNDAIEHIIKNVTDNLSSFKAMHPALKLIDKTSLLFNDTFSNKPINK